MIKTESRTNGSKIHTIIKFIWNKEKVPEEWNESIIYLFLRREIKGILVNIDAYHFCQLRTKFYSSSCCQS